jgi:hypothetical protein
MTPDRHLEHGDAWGGLFGIGNALRAASERSGFSSGPGETLPRRQSSQTATCDRRIRKSRPVKHNQGAIVQRTIRMGPIWVAYSPV